MGLRIITEIHRVRGVEQGGMGAPLHVGGQEIPSEQVAGQRLLEGQSLVTLNMTTPEFRITPVEPKPLCSEGNSGWAPQHEAQRDPSVCPFCAHNTPISIFPASAPLAPHLAVVS